MDIHHLRIFSRVFKNRSFSRASEELHLSQPTVSEHIRSLEDELRCKLFDRLGRRIIPTREAEALYNQSIEILEKVEGLPAVLGQSRQEMSGHLVIGASTIPGTYILPRIIASFRNEHPTVSFSIAISDSRGIIEKLTNHELLIGIVGAKLGNGHIHYASFLEDELIVIRSPSSKLAGTLSLKQLVELPMVMREEGSGTKKEFEKILERKGVGGDQIRVAAVLGSTDAVKQAVKEGIGVSIISRRAVLDELRCKILKEITIRDVEMKRHFFIVTHKKRTLPHAYQTFLNYLKSHE